MRPKIKVLIVDDSAFARFAISRQLQADPDIEVAGFAHDGAEALEKIPILKPDVVTLDVEMPRVDGLTALRHIMSTCPTPVVMLSSLTGEGTKATIKALELGAVDFFLKTSATTPAGTYGEDNGLKAKVKMAASVNVSTLNMVVSQQPTRVKTQERPRRRPGIPSKLAVIGSSTGGPRALYQVIPALPADTPAAILIVQHMPPGFTGPLADRLNQVSEIDVKEAEMGDVLALGQAFIAPGGYHMVIKKNGVIDLNLNPPVCGVRPSIDVTMESVALAFGALSVGVVLTGMGYDGTNGTSSIKEAGGKVIAEDESTCVVYGMPKSVASAGNADRIVPLPQIAAELIRTLNDTRKWRKP